MVEPTRPYNPFEARFGKSSTLLMPLAVGSVLIALALFLLVESEWRAVELEEQRAARAGVVEADPAAPDPEHEGRLVIVSGEVTPAEPPPEGIADTLPSVLTYRALVEEFDGSNWVPVEEDQESWIAPDAMLGEWTVPHRLWRRVPEVALTEDRVTREEAEELEPGVRRTRIVGIPAGIYSLVGEQTGDTLRPWRGLEEGESLFEMEPGVMRPEDVLPPADLAELQLVWVKRGGAFLAILMGYSMILGVLGLAVGLSGGRWWAGMGSLTLGTALVFAGISQMVAAGPGLKLLVMGLIIAGLGVVLLRGPAEESSSPEEDSGGEAS